MVTRWPGPSYEIRVSFDAPLDFVYRWCTDFTPQDSQYETEEYQRRILRRSSREVVYEDLEDTKDGWVWSRHVVRLLPPAHWRSDSVGTLRAYALDYRLKRLQGNRTQLTLKARRRPYGIGKKNPRKAQWERSTTAAWKSFARALERDYQKEGARPTER
ncbi:MAG: hypothetical protein ABSB97_00720 [Thermoplasmata archaeon]|jgi:hypothetical protein